MRLRRPLSDAAQAASAKANASAARPHYGGRTRSATLMRGPTGARVLGIAVIVVQLRLVTHEQ